MENEIKQLLEQVLREHFPNVDFPERIELELTNLPEPQAPPETPKIDISGLENTVKEFLNKKQAVTPATDLTEVEKLLANVIKGLKEIPKPETIDHREILGKVLEKLSEEPERFPQIEFFEELKKIVQRPQMTQGGIGPSKRSVLDKDGKSINPSTAVSDGETLNLTSAQGTLIAGKRDIALGKQKANYIGVGGIQTDALKVLDENNHILKEILVELKAIKLHQAYLTDVTFDGTE